MLTYGEIQVEQAKATCKKYKHNCSKCPLRRSRYIEEKSNIKEMTLICNFVLRTLLDEEQSNEFLKAEPLYHEDEWLKELKSVE